VDVNLGMMSFIDAQLARLAVSLPVAPNIRVDKWLLQLLDRNVNRRV
jgi:hypothetical protein